MSTAQLTTITNALLEYGKSISAEVLFPTVIPEAAGIIYKDPYAFCIATCLDRGTRAEVIWTIPYDIQKDLGHLDPGKIYAMTLDQLAALFKRLPRRPRYVNDAPKTIKELTRIVMEECGGDASLIWRGKQAGQVHRTFDSIHGVGPGIANMAVLLIERAFLVQFPDHWSMDIKPDIHTKRVLYRLGASDAETEDAAIKASRRMSPVFPGIVDAALWDIGRTWCSPTRPNCPECPITKICVKRIEM
jgi:endonuclease III